MPPKKKTTKEEVIAEMRELKECGFKRVQYTPLAIEKEFLSDRDFLLEALMLDGNILASVPEPLRYDRELLLIAAKNGDNDLYLEIELPKELLYDSDFMLRLVGVNGMFLRQWCFERRYSPFTDADKKIILAAVANNYEAFDDIHLKGNLDYYKDKDFALCLVAVDGRVLRYFGKELRGDKDIVLKAIEHNYQAFEFATNKLRTDEEFILRALEVNACVLAFAPKHMREDRALVTRLMQKTPFVYRYAKGEMRRDVGLALSAVKGAPNLYDFLDHEMTHENTEFILGLAEFVSAADTPKDVRDFLKSRLKLNSRYREFRAKNPDLDEDLTELLLADDVAETFTSEYNLDLYFKAEIDKFIPEVSACYKQTQRGDWHIYNVMGHILHSVDAMNAQTVGLADGERKLLAFTMFFHDLGKPEYHREVVKNGKMCDSFKGHNIGSEKTAERVLRHLKFGKEEQRIILTLVREHDVFIKFSKEPKNDRQIDPTAEYLREYISGLDEFGDGRKLFEYLLLVGVADNKAQNPKMIEDSLELIHEIRETVKAF